MFYPKHGGASPAPFVGEPVFSEVSLLRPESSRTSKIEGVSQRFIAAARDYAQGQP